MKLAVILALLLPLTAQRERTLEQVVGDMHAYLAEYSHHLPAMIATERYEQRAGSGVRRQRRLLESDFGLIQVPGNFEWLGFREVRVVDGRPVSDSARRLAALFAKPSPVAVRQARRIAEESARFNIGPIFRTINDPTIVLELLDVRHALRMRYSKLEETTIDRVRMWVIRFQEIERPTIIRTRDLVDMPVQGRAWVDPATGRLHRAEATVQAGLGNGNFMGTVDVRFAHDARMGFAVPATMSERYTNRNLAVVSSGEATYSNYRRFTVDTEEKLGADPQGPAGQD
jgi:hypothetical protein